MSEDTMYLTDFSKLQLLKGDILWTGNGEMTAFVIRHLWPLKACIVPYGIIPGEQVGI